VNLRRGFWSSFRSSTVFRCLLTLVALFYVAQHLSAVAHFALVRHAVCDEHGELVDVEATTSAAAAEGSPASELNSPQSSSHSGHGHEHCGVLAHLRPHLSAAVFAAIPVRVAARPDITIASRHRAPSLAIPIYRLAPKNSPPA
jgi:hypothetical protein